MTRTPEGITDAEMLRLFDGFQVYDRSLSKLGPDERPSKGWMKQLLGDYEQALVTLNAVRTTLEAQQAELEAARQVVEAARSAKAKHGFANIEEAVADYDAARAGGKGIRRQFKGPRLSDQERQANLDYLSPPPRAREDES